MKKQVMMLAWLIVRETGLCISDALRLSWKNIKLREAMHRGIVEFTYRKVSGEVRNAKGTLQEIVIPSRSTEGATRKSNDSVQCYYDCGKLGWRSFRKSNLVKIS